MAVSWRTVRVFISSTFRDMHAERDHLVKVVFPKLRQWCDDRRLHLVDVDLRWGVTEEEANDGKALDICLTEIDGSRPFFVCVLGGRYGWVPDPLPPDDRYQFDGIRADRPRSITHLEILHAADRPLASADGTHGEPCSHAFFYLRDDGCVPSATGLPLTDAQKALHADTYFERARPDDLASLKGWIVSTFGPRRQAHAYAGKWDRRAENAEENARGTGDVRLVGRLTALDRFGRLVYAQLRRAIGRQFAEHVRTAREAVDPVVDERGRHDAFIENRTQVHVPRPDVEARLTAYAEGVDRRPLVLSGPPGSGKSSLLAHWVKHRGGVAVIRFVGASAASTNLHRLLGGIARELVARFQLDEVVPDDPAELLVKWPRFLDAAARRGPVLVVIDALNQLDGSADPRHPSWLPTRLPAKLRLVVSVLDHDGAAPADAGAADWLGTLRSRSGQVIDLPVRPLTPAEQRDIIRRLPSVFCKKLPAHHIDELVCNRATTNPLFLCVALEELRVHGGHKTLAERIGRLPQLPQAGRTIDDALNDLFGQVLDRLNAEATVAGLVPAAFQLLASAKEGLDEGELRDLVARALPAVADADRRAALAVVLRQVRGYLMRNGSLLNFYHRSFWKAVRAKYLKDATDRHKTHADLASYFGDQPYWLSPARPNGRKLAELPWQRVRAAREAQGLASEFARRAPADLEATFTDLDLIEAKCAAGWVSELVADYQEALAVPGTGAAVEGFAQFVRSRRHVLAAAPRLAYQEAANEPDVTAPAAAARQRLAADGTSRPWIRRVNKPDAPSPCLLTLAGDQPVVNAIAISDDGAYLAATGSGVAIWEAATGRLVTTFARGGEDLVDCAFTPDGRHVVVLDVVHKLALWRVDSGTPAWAVTTAEPTTKLAANQESVRDRRQLSKVAVTPDGSRITTQFDNTLKQWDAHTGASLQSLTVDDANWSDVAFSPGGAFAVCVGRRRDGKRRAERPQMLVWDLIAGRLKGTGPKGILTSVRKSEGQQR